LEQVAKETVPALVELREKGLVSYVGITDLQLENLKWVVENVEEGSIDSILNFCHNCLNDDKLTDFLDFFEERGIGVINASPLSMGLLSQRGIPDWHPAPKPLVEACSKAAEFCTEQGYPIEKLAIQYSIQNPRIASTLFSSANPQNVKRNVEWAMEPIDMQLVEKVREIIGNQFRVSWKNS
jgi:aryl-alcohol dehydrogenase-like predicted oxidoreductase